MNLHRYVVRSLSIMCKELFTFWEQESTVMCYKQMCALSQIKTTTSCLIYKVYINLLSSYIFSKHELYCYFCSILITLISLQKKIMSIPNIYNLIIIITNNRRTPHWRQSPKSEWRAVLKEGWSLVRGLVILMFWINSYIYVSHNN